jgi:cytochrome P450
MTKTLPPGPKGTFLGGHLARFREGRLDFLTRCARDYGDFVSLRLGPRRVVLVSDPDAIEHVLVTAARQVIKHFALRFNPVVLGNGLLTSDGDFWLRQRRLAQPAFHRPRVAGYAAVMVEHTERLLADWRAGRECDVTADMSRLTLGIAAETLFGADAGDAGKVRAALEVAQQAFLRRFNRLVPVPWYVPTPANLRFLRAVRQLDDVVYGFIRRRRAADEGRGDLLSLLLHARDEDDGGQMTDKQLRDEAMTLFLAGHETTALALAWTWYLLARHPQAEERLAAEAREVLGDRPATADDMPRLAFAVAVVQESMRLYPPAYLLGRETLGELELGGYRLPRGTTVFMSQWVVQRDPRWFDRPDEFVPERWLGGLAKRLPKFAYFPFGGGPRLCIGNTFAQMELVLVVATLARAYRFTLADAAPVEPLPTFTLRPARPIRAVLVPRS